jgi:hypothetical protein
VHATTRTKPTVSMYMMPFILTSIC